MTADPILLTHILIVISVGTMIAGVILLVVSFLVRRLVVAPPRPLERVYGRFRRRRVPEPRHAPAKGRTAVWDAIDGVDQTRAFVPWRRDDADDDD